MDYPQTDRRMPRRIVSATLLALVLLLLPITLFAQQGGSDGVVVSNGLRVNVRSGSANTFPVVAKLANGTIVSVLETSTDGEWLRVLAAGLSQPGWVSADFVQVSELPVDVPTVSRVTPAASLRSALANAAISGQKPAATSAAVRVVLPTATPVSAQTNSPAMAATAVPTAVPAVVPTAAPTAVPTAAPSTVATATVEAAEVTVPTAIVTANSINLRKGPGTNFDRVGAAAAGSNLEITGVNPAGDWYRVALADGGEGWVFSSLVTTAGPMANVKRLTDSELPAPPAVAAAPASAAVASAPQPTGGGGFGYGVTANMWQRDKASVGNYLADLGFPWVKQQIRWEFVEPAPGAISWQEMDGMVNTMNDFGRNLAFSVVTAPDWTRPNKGGTNGPPEDFQQFANFLGAIAGRYCGQSLKAIEVWNEQNLRREWEGYALDPALYMDLLKRSYASIKAACPGMIVVSGATTPAGYSDVAFDDIDYLRGMYQNGLARYSDAVGIHPSGFANPPSVRFSDWESGSYSAPSHVNHRSFYFLSTLEQSRAVMEQFGDSAKKLWPTEFGWGSTPSPYAGYEYQARVSEQQQADWISSAFQTMASSGYVGAAFLWNLNYDYGEMQTFSVVGRPAYDALKALAARQ